MRNRYEVIESIRWVNKVTGQKVSIYGAVPFCSKVEEQDWELKTVGFTVRDIDSGRIGVGRIPWGKKEEAQAFVDKFNQRTA